MKNKSLLSFLSMGVIIGFVWTIFISLGPTIENRYFGYGMTRLVAAIFQRNILLVIPLCLLISIFAYIIFFLFCPLSKLKLNRIANFTMGKCVRVVGGVVVVFLIIFNVAFTIDDKIKPSGPNVLLIIVDALRADSLGCYNELSANTPNIDRFSETAILFDNSVAQSSNTFNAAPCILASVYPSEHKYFNYKVRVSDKFNTIAEFLKNEKYTTFSISTNPHVTIHNGLGQGFDTFIEDTVWKNTDCDEVNKRFIEWVEDNKDQKFFSMLWYIDPHAPYEPPSEYIEKYVVNDDDKEATTKKAMRKAGARKGPITKMEKEVAKKLYNGEVNFFDKEFGELIKYLEASGLMEDIIVIITADHGESFWEKDIRGHGGSLYEEEIKIPLIFSLPGLREGKVVKDKVQQIDVLPTILEYVNPDMDVASIPYIRGNGLRSLIEGETGQVKYSFSQLIDTRAKSTSYHMECIQTEDFKLIKTFKFRGKACAPPTLQLFDIRSSETDCDVNDEKFKPIYDELRRELMSWHNSFEVPKRKPEKPTKTSKDSKKQVDEDKRLKQRLKSLGYVE